MKHNRKAFLDILRVVLSLCVIAHHVIGNAISTHQFGASIPENIWSSLSALLLWTVFDFLSLPDISGWAMNAPVNFPTSGTMFCDLPQLC